MSPVSNGSDKAGKTFWDATWDASQIPRAVDPRSGKLANLFARRMDKMFRRVLADGRDGRTLIEVGCGRSAWLPYFNLQFGLEVSGIDYSELGCEQARQILVSAGVEGEVVCADLFTPPARLLESFDIVVTLGVVEHFSDTTECIAACARFLTPGSTMVTLVPNMRGTLGLAQRGIDRSVYDVHVPISRSALRSAHADAGLIVTDCEYFLSTGYGLLRVGGEMPHKPVTVLKRSLIRAAESLSVLIWWLEDGVGRQLPRTRWFSPYIICSATKPPSGVMTSSHAA